MERGVGGGGSRKNLGMIVGGRWNGYVHDGLKASVCRFSQGMFDRAGNNGGMYDYDL